MLVAFAGAGAGDIGFLCFAKGDACAVLRQFQRVGHRNVGGCEHLAGEIGRACQLPRHQAHPALENVQRLTGAPVLPFGFRRETARADDKVDGGREAGFAKVEELLVSGERGIVRGGCQRRRPVADHQVFHDRDGFDHGDVAVPDRRDETGRVDGQEFRVLLDAGQKVHRPQPVREPHLFQQPDDPKASSFAKDRDHRQSCSCGSALSALPQEDERGLRQSTSTTRPSPTIPAAPAMPGAGIGERGLLLGIVYPVVIDPNAHFIGTCRCPA